MKWRLLAVSCGILALGLLLYPLIGELLSERYHSDVETVYAAAIADADDAELTAQRRAAEVYNAMLRGEASVSAGGASAPPLLYAEQLTVGGAMCTIDIPKIGVYLPVQHGTGAETLERAVGHVVGTSLPVGGSGTHAVLSAHSGMASAKLFSDIDQLVEGDTFYIHVLDEVLAYEVDQIATVLPSDTSLLQIEDEQDLVTLVTCTPFGVNTHRLLVRGASGAVCAGAGDRKQHDAEGRFLMDAALSHWLGRWPWRVGWGWWYLLFCKEAMPWIRKLLCWRWCWRWWGCWLCCGRWFPGIGCKGI